MRTSSITKGWGSWGTGLGGYKAETSTESISATLYESSTVSKAVNAAIDPVTTAIEYTKGVFGW